MCSQEECYVLNCSPREHHATSHIIKWYSEDIMVVTFRKLELLCHPLIRSVSGGTIG